MKYILQIKFLFIIFPYISIYISLCIGLFPLGSDVHIKCPTKAMQNQPISLTSIFSKNNVKQIFYTDSLYLVISDFSHNNKGTYSCPKTEPITQEIVNPSSSNEVTKFRVVGGSLVLFCTCAVNTVKWKWTSFLRKTGSINVIQSTLFRSEHFIERVSYPNSIYNGNEVKIYPVDFEDAGKYQLSQYGNTINLITIQVMAFPSAKVHIGSTVQLTCLVSHLLADMGVSLIWTKYSGYTSIHVKTQKLNLTYLKNNILIEDIKMEEITHWACLVFNKDHLVASAPIVLNYIKPPGSVITKNYGTSITTTTSRTMLMSTTDSVDEDLPNELQIGNYLLISCIFMILLNLSVFCIFRRLKTLDGKNVEAQTNVPLSAEVQYSSVKFYKRPTEPQETSVINHNQDSDSEVVYTSVWQNE